MARIGKNQALVLQYLQDRGGLHVYLAPGCRSDCLRGFTWEEVERSLHSLVRRGLVIKVKQGFYSLP